MTTRSGDKPINNEATMPPSPSCFIALYNCFALLNFRVEYSLEPLPL